MSSIPRPASPVPFRFGRVSVEAANGLDEISEFPSSFDICRARTRSRATPLPHDRGDNRVESEGTETRPLLPCSQGNVIRAGSAELLNLSCRPDP